MIDFIIEAIFTWGYKSKSIPSWTIPLAISVLCVVIAFNAHAADRSGLAAILLFFAAASVSAKIYYVTRTPDPS